MKKLLNIIKLWPELWSLPAVLLLWWLSPWLVLQLDSTAATFDSGILQIFALAIIGTVLANGVVFAGIRFNWRWLYRHYAGNSQISFSSDYLKITPWQRVLLSLSLYLGLMLTFALLVAGISG